MKVDEQKDMHCKDVEDLTVHDCLGRPNSIKARGTDSARVIQVIETRALAGSGTNDDPVYIKFQYWNFEGKLLAEGTGY